MSILAKINQRESLEKIEEIKPILYTQVLVVLSDNQSYTAREIAKRIGRTTRGDIQPRITELKRLGLIIENGKKWDKLTKRNVMSYKLAGKKI